MHKLIKGSHRFEKFYTTLDGVRFRGIIYPAKDGNLPIGTFVEPRLLLRTRTEEPVKAGDMFRDQYSRVMLCGTHGLKDYAKLYTLFELPEHLPWTRVITTNHPVTGAPRRSGSELIGQVWCSLEDATRISPDGGLRLDIARNRIITAADIQDGDMIGDMIVKRVYHALGITIAEAE